MAGTVCPNIGPAERRKRAVMGVACLILGVLVVFSAWAIGMSMPLRLALAAGFAFGGFTGVFQARDRTCVALASRGLRDLDGGPERIQDVIELAAVQAQSRAVLKKSGIATVLATLAAAALP